MNNQNFNNQGMNNQQGFQQQAAPQQQYANNIMSGSFTAESAGAFTGGESNFNRNPNIQLIPEGTQIGRIYKILDIGTHIGFKNEAKRQIKVFFEFPQFCQQFDLDKPDLKPSVVSSRFNFFIGSKSNLRSLMEAVAGRKLSDQEAKVFDFQSLLGQMVIVTISHKEKKNDPSIKFTNIINYSAINYDMIIIPQEFSNPQIYRNPITAFYLGENAINLTKENFANLPLSDRKTIIASQEAINFLNNGGIVFRNENNSRDNFYNQPIDNNQQNAQANGFTPIDNNNQPQQGFQQQGQSFQNQQPQHAFGQSVHQAMQGENNNGNFNGQPQQGFQQQQPNQNFQQQQGFQQQPNPNQQGNQGFGQQANPVQNQGGFGNNGVPSNGNFGGANQNPNQQQQFNNQQGFEQAPQQNPQQGFPSQGQQPQQMGSNGNGFQQQQPTQQVDNSFSQSFDMGNDGEDDLPF